ncbi:MAG: hypothetical protein WC514_02040 [Candidatus Paceibacterota bacterium]
MPKLVKYIIIGVIAAGLIAAGIFLYIKNTNGSGQKVAEKAIEYINKNLLEPGMTASLVDVVEESGLYKFRLKIGDQEYNSYVTKDGKLLWPQDGINLSATTSQTGAVSQETPKSDNVDVKLFVMSYCPYGLQAEKMFLPVYNLLKEKATMGIYFVNYIMHEKQEIDENLTQYCIQKNEKEKYSAYLSCFVKAGDSAGCLTGAGINKSTLNNCVSETDSQYGVTAGYNDKSTWLSGQYPAFKVNDDLNQKYGVQGSPTVVINDTVIEVSDRSPENFKQIVCNAFNTPPAECSQTLSSDAASPGLGEVAGSNTSSGGCAQ